MASLMNCPNCGASITILGQQPTVKCEYCRSIVPVSNVNINVNPAPVNQNQQAFQNPQNFNNQPNYQVALKKWKNKIWLTIGIQVLLGFVFYTTLENAIDVLDVLTFLAAVFLNIACPIAFALTQPQPPPPLKNKKKLIKIFLLMFLYFLVFWVGIFCSAIWCSVLF